MAAPAAKKKPLQGRGFPLHARITRLFGCRFFRHAMLVFLQLGAVLSEVSVQFADARVVALDISQGFRNASFVMRVARGGEFAAILGAIHERFMQGDEILMDVHTVFRDVAMGFAGHGHACSLCRNPCHRGNRGG